jgi:hypothetical protein
VQAEKPAHLPEHGPRVRCEIRIPKLEQAIPKGVPPPIDLALGDQPFIGAFGQMALKLADLVLVSIERQTSTPSRTICMNLASGARTSRYPIRMALIGVFSKRSSLPLRCSVVSIRRANRTRACGPA